MSKDTPRCNHEITASEVRVVDDAGNVLGVLKLHQALKLAVDKGLDLVEVSPGVEPPVCKVMNYGKYRYEAQKKMQAAKKNQKVVELKEIKVRPNIADGDIKIKLKSALKFLKDGNKVRISLIFKGREISHEEVGLSVINKFKSELSDFCKIDAEPKLEGKQIFMIVSPK